MSEFSVVTSEIQAMSARLGTIGPDIDEITGQMGSHASAAAQTSADAAMGELMGRWAAALPRFGLSGERLQTAMGGAATAYNATDSRVAEGAAEAAGGPAPGA